VFTHIILISIHLTAVINQSDASLASMIISDSKLSTNVFVMQDKCSPNHLNVSARQSTNANHELHEYITLNFHNKGINKSI